MKWFLYKKWGTHQQPFSFGKTNSPLEGSAAPVLVGSVSLGGTTAEKQHRVLVLLQMHPVQQNQQQVKLPVFVNAMLLK